MATYNEIAGIRAEDGFGAFRDKVVVAVLKKAQSLLDGATPTAAEVEWAQATLLNPSQAAESVLFYVVAANSGAALSQILSATDAAVQVRVDAAVDKLTAAVL